MGVRGWEMLRDTVQSVCPACGNMFSVAIQETGKPVQCDKCGKPIVIVSHSSVNLPAVGGEEVRAEITGSPKSSGGRERVPSSQFARKSGGNPTVDSAAQSSQWHLAVDADPEAGMITQAWDAFKSKGWKCTDWPNVKAFAAVVRVPGGEGKPEQELNLTVSGTGGILTLETVLARCPVNSPTNLRVALNRANVRTGGTVLQLRSCGVVARYKLLPRRIHKGVVSKDGVLRALSQLNRDLINARKLLGNDMDEVLPPTSAAIEKAFSKPLAAQITSQRTTQQLIPLAEHVELRAKAKGAILYLARKSDPAGQFPIWLSISGNVLRGWAIPGSKGAPAQKKAGGFMGLFSRMTGPVPGPQLEGPQLDKLLDNVDRINESYRHLQYVWNGQQVLGMAIFPPTEKRMEPDEFRKMTDILFECAEQDLKAPDGSMLMAVPT